MYRFFFNNTQILHLLYFNNPIGIKSTGPFQITLEKWEGEENKSLFTEEKKKNARWGEYCTMCAANVAKRKF